MLKHWGLCRLQLPPQPLPQDGVTSASHAQVFSLGMATEIRCCTVACSERSRSVCLAQPVALGESVVGNPAATSIDFSLPCLGANQRAPVPASYSPSVSPSGPPTSQGGLSLPHGTPGLQHSTCGLKCSLLCVHPYNLPFSLSPPPRGTGPKGIAFLLF